MRRVEIVEQQLEHALRLVEIAVVQRVEAHQLLRRVAERPVGGDELAEAIDHFRAVALLERDEPGPQLGHFLSEAVDALVLRDGVEGGERLLLVALGQLLGGAQPGQGGIALGRLLGDRLEGGRASALLPAAASSAAAP